MIAEKTCKDCQQTLAIDNFYADKTRTDGFRATCKKCMSEKKKAKYASSAELRRYCIERNNGRRARRFRHLDRYKRMVGCQHCGYNKHAFCLDFHHVDDNKEGQISRMGNSNLKKLIREVRKCIVLCAMCHRIEHNKEKINE